MSEAEQVAATAGRAAEAAREAVSWLEDETNASKVGTGRTDLIRNFRRLRLAAAKLERAATQPTCVGVFGPSQAGKSYLVSVLARPEDRPCVALFDDELVDFLSEINPEGGKESTGLVTRFTLQPRPHPPGFPVCLRLLSEADIVRILGNTFFLDIDLKDEIEPDRDAIQAVLEQARARAAGLQPGLTEEDVWEIQEYFEAQFEGTSYLAALRSVWDEAATLLPRLQPRDRAPLVSLLWGRREPFTQLYTDLAAALLGLGHAAEAFCGLDALRPRATSIIDVATLAGLGKEGAPALELRTLEGRTASLPRPIVTALTAELRMVLRERPWPFLAHTDLLDFPGARSRQKVSFEHFFKANAEPLKESFLRGKVAFLFDRYVAEQELSSMLLCIPDGNIEVMTLPDMVADWIARTHGATPEERVGRPIVLLFVMTKFDVMFTEKAGVDAANPGTRFANRIIASLTDNLFGRAHEWPREWTPGTPFNNCFWLRNPSYPAESIIVYDEAKREVEFRADKREYLDRLKQAYLEVPSVRAHFADPARAWDEALKLNDGGVSFLAKKLEAICEPAMKTRQVAARLAALTGKAAAALARFHVADDLETRLVQRRQAAGTVVDALYQLADLGRFGHLLRALTIASAELADMFYQVEVRPVDVEGREIRVVSTGPRMPAARARPGAAPASPPSLPVAGPRAVTRDQLLASAALRHWFAQLERMAQSIRTAHALGIDGPALTELTNELAAGARRLDLAGAIASAIDRAQYLEKSGPAVQKAALLAAAAVNSYGARLGFDGLPPDRRPEVDTSAGRRPVFQERPIAHDAVGLAARPKPFTDRVIEDWAFAFYRLVEENASSEGGQQVDLVQNARLGRIIGELRAPLASAA